MAPVALRTRAAMGNCPVTANAIESDAAIRYRPNTIAPIRTRALLAWPISSTSRPVQATT